MSTNVSHARPNRTDRSDSTHTDESAAPPADTTPTARRSSSATRPTGATASDAPPRRTPDDWTRRCQRQFEPGATDRLRNLVDEANLVVVSPGADRA